MTQSFNPNSPEVTAQVENLQLIFDNLVITKGKPFAHTVKAMTAFGLFAQLADALKRGILTQQIGPGTAYRVVEKLELTVQQVMEHTLGLSGLTEDELTEAAAFTKSVAGRLDTAVQEIKNANRPS